MSYAPPVVVKHRGRSSTNLTAKSDINNKQLIFNGGMNGLISGTVSSQLVIPATDAGIPIIEFDGHGDTITRGHQVGSETDMGSGARFIGMKNTGYCSLEIYFTCGQWKQTAGADAFCSPGGDFKEHANVSMLLHPGEFITLPTNRFVIYNLSALGTQHSAAEGVKIEDEVIGVTDGTGLLKAELGPDPMPALGIVPGSVFITFARPAYVPLGLTASVVPGTSSGLTADTDYDFTYTYDGVVAADVEFTTDATDVSWGGQNGVLSKMNNAIKLSKPDLRVTIARDELMYHPEDIGDVVLVHNKAVIGTSTIDWTTAASISGTDLFGAGEIPLIGNVGTPVSPSEVTSSKAHIMKDDGHQNLRRSMGGVGEMRYDDYPNWTLSGCPKYSTATLYAKGDAAHSGKTRSSGNDPNIVMGIYATAVTTHHSAFSEHDGSLETTIFS